MKILIALPYFPYPPNSGGQQATFHMINYLRNHEDITLICPEANRNSLEELRKKWPNVSIIVTSPHDALFGTRNYFRYYSRLLYNKFKQTVKSTIRKNIKSKRVDPLDICNQIRQLNMRIYRHNFLLENDRFVNQFQHLVYHETFDIIQLEFAELLGLVHCIPVNCKKIFVHHELTFKVIERELQTIENAKGYEIALLKQEKMIEMQLLNKFDQILVFSDQDKLFLRNAGLDINKILLSSFTIPLSSSVGRMNSAFTYKNKIVFLGSDSHNPNLDAVYWFVREVYPGILQKFPATTFKVIGSWSREVTKLFKEVPGLHFTGYIENLNDELEGAVMLVPIRIGSGIRTKVIDAVMRRVPVLTTSIGIEGIPLEDAKECLIADDPESFVKKIGLLHDDEFAGRLISNALLKINQWSDVDKCGQQRHDIYRNLAPGNIYLQNNLKRY